MLERPCSMVRFVGDAVVVKSGVGGVGLTSIIVRGIVTLCSSVRQRVRAVPVMVISYSPGGVVCVALTISVEFAVVLGSGRSTAGSSVMVTSGADVDVARVTLLLKLFTDVIVMIVVLDPP